ncbi:uncharacterized protein N7515_004086 [Penicillium bovifimosum]|uniref:Uncharacterized protein n=1 Tax=Penicillium bovifimosum TaxID=126998 RepID=A0A9W9H6B6_9EURO|nr:uncharacterized protein N7515_004086 [Penicillium bovifimosum]KAJ5139238.1 hypothetical protein N7515_004086 [Penicillium bovifimosum]
MDGSPKITKDGVSVAKAIQLKEGKTLENELEVGDGVGGSVTTVEGHTLGDPKSQKVEFEKPLILLSEKKISAVQDILLPFLRPPPLSADLL